MSPHAPVDVDPQFLKSTKDMWLNFITLMKWSLIGVIAVLAGMALFLL